MAHTCHVQYMVSRELLVLYSVGYFADLQAPTHTVLLVTQVLYALDAARSPELGYSRGDSDPSE